MQPANTETRYADAIAHLAAGNLVAGYVGTWWSTMTPMEFFIAIGLIAAAAGAALAALATMQRRTVSAVPA